MLATLETLGQHVGDPLETSHVTILDRLTSKVLPGVDVLGMLPRTDDVVQPFDARSLVLKQHIVVPLLQSHVAQ